jgi:hypothetical protein
MSVEKILKLYADIFENLADYALVRNQDGIYSKTKIVYKPTMGFVLIEEYAEELKELMIKRGVAIADSEDEIRPSDFKPHQLIWDEEKKEWRKIYADEINKILEEKSKKKGK